MPIFALAIRKYGSVAQLNRVPDYGSGGLNPVGVTKTLQENAPMSYRGVFIYRYAAFSPSFPTRPTHPRTTAPLPYLAPPNRPFAFPSGKGKRIAEPE